MKTYSCLLLFVLLFVGVSCDKQPETIYKESLAVVTAENISNQQIACFGEDELGYIWIGTNRGVNKYNGYNFLQYFHSEDSFSLSNNQVRNIFSDSKGRLWVGSRNGVNLYNKQGVFTRIPIESNSQNTFQIRESDNNRIFINTALDICEFDAQLNRFVKRISFPEESAAIYGFYMDEADRFWVVSTSLIRCYDSNTFSLISSFPVSYRIHYSYLRENGELWLASENRITVLDTKSNGFASLPVPIHNHPVLSKAILTLVYPYDDVSLLIKTQRDGLFLYNSFTSEIIHQAESNFPLKVPDTDITVMYRDSNSNFWIGSYDQGFTVQYNDKQRFNSNEYLRTRMEGQSVISTAMDKEQNLWIVTRTQGLKVWSRTDQRIWDINLEGFFPEDTYYQDRVNAVFVDSKNNIWLQTNGKLLLCRYKNGRLLRDKTFYVNTIINCMTEDHTGTIWAAGGDEFVYFLDSGEAAFKSMRLYPRGFHFTNGLLMLSGGKILIASFEQSLRLLTPETKEMEEFDILPKMSSGVYVPSVVYEDSRGIIWIGTIGSGLFKCSLQDRKVESVEGLSCNEVSSLMEDAQGNLWIGTLYGLCKYDHITQQVTSYYKNDGIGGSQFNERSSCRLNNQTMVFGGTHGLTVFDPVDVTSRSHIPLFIEELKVHNQKVLPEKKGIIETDIILNPKVTLDYNQNSIQISYAALDYSEYQRVKYAYKLEGFDPYWVEANTHRQAFYSNLPAGDYTFMVKSMSADNTVEEIVTSLSIHIKRAPWLSIPMLILYALAVLGTVLCILHLYLRLKVNRERTRQAIYEKEQEQKINQMNMSFFANISHEFRTPLTMIAGPVSQLCNEPDIRNENKNLLVIIQRSVDRMLRLINQLMDFNKLENDTLSLRVESVEITEIIKEQLDIFRINAEEKQTSLVTSGLQNPCRMWVDTDMLQKTLSNLLSNAVKFSRAGGVIDVNFDVISGAEAACHYPLTDKDTDKEYAEISVGDTGIGIPEDKLDDIFKRYYQVANNEKERINWGTGIGLYYSRRLVEMHHGYIKAENKAEGGALFSFIIPVNMESYTKPERDFEMKEQADMIQTPTPFATSLHNETKEKAKNTLLVVDDDTEISHYLRSLLSSTYRVVSCFDAENAWELIDKVEPDLIISDVVMQGMDGFTFCSKLKENLSTCHIPVILLTAKVTVNDQVEGLNVGANAYVTKPFDPSYLLALVKSQLKNRENIREILSGSTKSNTLSGEILSSQDVMFMDSLYKLMETELSDPELNITRMTELLHISRTKFYYKVKGLTGENPNTFFKTYKLNRAVELIRENKYTMSEIADLTGFSTASHFSASFKKKFGVSPSEY